MVFLQLHDNFKPKDFDRVEKFVKDWPKEVPLAIEVRSAEWFEEENFEKFSQFLEENNIANIIVDTAGRRDMLHMRLTSDTAFVRYVGANADSEYGKNPPRMLVLLGAPIAVLRDFVKQTWPGVPLILCS
jgi:uncharacterized protein YecE (DUF72 family)